MANFSGTENGETLNGTGSDDFIFGYGGNDRLFGNAGFDVLYGGEGNDELHTGGGNGDFLYGGPGDDLLFGEGGSNYYFFTGKDDGYDTIVGSPNQDLVYATRANTAIGLKAFSGVELISCNTYAGVSIRGTGGAENFDFRQTFLDGITLIDGGAGNDTIWGSRQPDTIMGGGGNDMLYGFDGDDIFVVALGDGVDRFDGGLGTDTVRAAADGTVIGIAGLSAVERITGNGFANVSIATTAGNDTLDLSSVAVTGIARIVLGAGNDIFFGSQSDDYIVGGAGSDQLSGGSGDDTFEAGAGAGSDTIDGGAGYDTIRVTAATFVWSGITNVEALVGTDLKLTGTTGADVIDLSGVAVTGVTKVWAGLGNDTVYASAGGGRIEMSDGQDVFYAGAGADRFELDRFSHSKVGAADRIAGFEQGADLIDLSAVDASTKIAGDQAFTFLGESGGFTGFVGAPAFIGVAGEIYVVRDEERTTIYGDVNGDRVADFQIDLTGSIALTADDFLL